MRPIALVLLAEQPLVLVKLAVGKVEVFQKGEYYAFGFSEDMGV